MKHLKSYKSYNYKIFENIQTDEEIHELCRKYRIENYTINEDKSIDVDGYVYLKDLGLTKLPLKFRHVKGNFNCRNNRLTTLEGAPETVGGYFDCSYSNLTTLEGVPETVSGHFSCSNNKLTTLEGAPRRVDGNFICSYNKNLMSLEGIFSTIHGDFYCNNTPVFYFWNEFLNRDKSLIDSFVEEWDVIHEDTVIIEYLKAYMEANNINKEINIAEIKSLGYKIGY